MFLSWDMSFKIDIIRLMHQKTHRRPGNSEVTLICRLGLSDDPDCCA